MRLLPTNRTRKLEPIIVALILGGAHLETRASRGGQKYMKPMPCTAQNRKGQTHSTRPGESRIAVTRIRWAPPQMQEPTPIFHISEGSLPVPRPCHRHKANRSGSPMILKNGSIDWYQGIGT